MIQCIAIDDEPLALKQVAAYIGKTPFLHLSGQFESALEAFSFLQNNEVDLMFVDINMPDLNGMEFVKMLSKAPKIIFTTAYSEYALEGYKVDAVDYLLKPIGFNDFLKAVEKAHDRILPKKPEAVLLTGNEEFIFIKSEYKVLRINLADIKYIESKREYLQLHLSSEKPVMTLMSMKKIEEHLPQDRFMRVHRSYIVNLNKITTIERNRIIFDEKNYIPVSEQYKAQFQEYLEKNFLL